MAHQLSNSQIIKNRFPELADATRNCSPDPAYILRDNRLLKVQFSCGLLHPFGQKNPTKLIHHWLSEQKIQENSIYALCGFGNAYFIREILSQAPKNTRFFIYEQNAKALKNVIENEDITDILLDNRIILATDGIDEKNTKTGEIKLSDAIYKGIKDWPLQNLNEVRPLIYAPLYNLNEALYAAFLKEFARQVSVSQRLDATNIQDTALWQAQTFKNLPILLPEPDVGVMKDVFKGLPVILVSAGPSLDTAIDFLRKAQDHAVIVSVNSSHKMLISNGIRPHVTLAADPRIETFWGYDGLEINGKKAEKSGENAKNSTKNGEKEAAFGGSEVDRTQASNVSSDRLEANNDEGCRADEVFLCAPFFVNSNVAKLFQRRIFTWSNNNLVVNYFFEKLGMPEPTKIDELGTVSASILGLARLWGVEKLCLVGQDLAVRETGQVHSEGTFYEEKGLNLINVKKLRSVDGNSGGKVKCTENLFTYWKVFNQLFKDCDDLKAINTSIYGAKIENVEFYSYDKALEFIGEGDVSGVRERLANCFKIREKSMVFLIFFANFAKKIKNTIVEEVLKLALDVAFHGENLRKKLAKNSYSRDSGIISAYDKFRKLTDFLKKHEKESQIIFEGKSKKELLKYMEFCEQEFDCEPHWERIQKNVEYAWAVAEGAYFLLQTLDEALGADLEAS